MADKEKKLRRKLFYNDNPLIFDREDGRTILIESGVEFLVPKEFTKKTIKKLIESWNIVYDLGFRAGEEEKRSDLEILLKRK